jgi:hypothetical protein
MLERTRRLADCLRALDRNRRKLADDLSQLVVDDPRAVAFAERRYNHDGYYCTEMTASIKQK